MCVSVCFSSRVKHFEFIVSLTNVFCVWPWPCRSQPSDAVVFEFFFFFCFVYGMAKCDAIQIFELKIEHFLPLPSGSYAQGKGFNHSKEYSYRYTLFLESLGYYIQGPPNKFFFSIKKNYWIFSQISFFIWKHNPSV